FGRSSSTPRPGGVGRSTAARATGAVVPSNRPLRDCFADASQYGAPWVDIGYQHDTDVLRFELTTTGIVESPTYKNATTTVSNLTTNIAPNGLVEFDVVLDVDVTDSYLMTHHWHLVGHVAGDCPAN